LKPFDLLNAPLEGINLIEASAGTGKTYNIEGLFIRLILELQLQVDQILVLTFTNAATDELKGRIRSKLVQAREAFSGSAIDDPLIAALVQKYPDPKAARQRLHETLIDFDRAAIFTIHGFCQRVLQENAFETHNLFDTELITNQNYLIQDVVDDFWRRTFYHAPLELVSFVVNRIKGPQYFYRLLGSVKNPDVAIIPDIVEPALDALPSYRAALSAVKSAWTAAREAVIRALSDPALNATFYGSLKPAANYPGLTQRDLQVITLIDAMDHLANPLSFGFPLFDKFEKLTTAKLRASTKKNHATPEHEFFDLCEALLALQVQLNAEMESYLVFVKIEMFAFAGSELQKRKKKENVQYFDDLLLTLQSALRSESGAVLAAAVGQKYKAALVDEFQDTDNTQYDILNRLFAQQNGLLFMIGDPKQAIYSFRGADIFSYMKAARSAAATFTLTKNWRSRPELITAVNTLFGNTQAPFVYEEIPFEKGQSARQTAGSGDGSDAPLVMWYLDSARFSPDGKPINKAEAVGRIAEAVGSEIFRLISGPKPEAPGDIAVLVRTNDQAQLVKDILSRRNVPSVLYSTGNIFDSREAAEVEKLLIAIADPASISRLKAALATDIMGLLADDLLAHDLESYRWDNRLARFREYHRLWERYGFVRMFRQLLADEQVQQRLLGLAAGERRLTNVLHLSEILHRQAMDRNAGMIDLIKWLGEQRNPATPRLEEYQLRLESDEKAVKIVTIHKSKGLEYPIVFCPFGWESSLIRGTEFTFHNIDDDRRLTLELGSDSASRHVVLAQNELLSENLRLLYVALTRAKERCYLAWGRISTAETSALAYLLHGSTDRPSPAPTDSLTQLTRAQFGAKTDAELIDDLNRLAAKSRGSIRIEPLPEPSPDTAEFSPQAQATGSLFARRFDGRIDHSWRIASYSSLVAAGAPDLDLPDRDVVPGTFAPAPGIAAEELKSDQRPDDHSIYAFPRGTRAGTFFHDVLEHHDFADGNPDRLSRLVAQKLQQYGFDPKWQATVCRSLTEVLAVSLRPDLPQLRLSAVAMTERANEMEFYFPLNQISSRSLPTIFNGLCRTEKLKDLPVQLEKLEFAPVRGYMKGYIDLVFQHQGRFYLVDWKSNFLGADPQHYDQTALCQTMQADLYTLQYHLYTLALHLHLGYQKPGYRYENDFGGVFYIFLRGVDLARGPEYGIYFDRPAPELLHALGEAMIPGYLTATVNR